MKKIIVLSLLIVFLALFAFANNGNGPGDGISDGPDSGAGYGSPGNGQGSGPGGGKLELINEVVLNATSFHMQIKLFMDGIKRALVELLLALGNTFRSSIGALSTFLR